MRGKQTKHLIFVRSHPFFFWLCRKKYFLYKHQNKISENVLYEKKKVGHWTSHDDLTHFFLFRKLFLTFRARRWLRKVKKGYLEEGRRHKGNSQVSLRNSQFSENICQFTLKMVLRNACSRRLSRVSSWSIMCCAERSLEMMILNRNSISLVDFSLTAEPNFPS